MQVAPELPDGAARHTPQWRPQCHFAPQRHWVNDPNGLIWLPDPPGALARDGGGEYHLYFQHNPFGIEWGHMSWGHAVSRDLLHWDERPVAIPEDARASIFSGSIVVDHHNTSGLGGGTTPAPLVAIYTECLRRPEGGQAQSLAFSLDGGETWTQHAHNPVLDLEMQDFRDPKVFWHAPTARWIMAVVLPNERQVVFYGSSNLRQWAELSRFGSALANQGIWECPDLFALPIVDAAGAPRGQDGPPRTAWLLKVDVFEGHPSQGSGARLFVGQFDGTRFVADALQPTPWADHGADFYAALSWANLRASPIQRQVWIGWMSCHRYAKHLPTHPWRGSMSLPREVSVHQTPLGLQVRQVPVREWRAALGAPATLHACTSWSEDAAVVVDWPAAWAAPAFNQVPIACELTWRVQGIDEGGLTLNLNGAMVSIARRCVGDSPPHWRVAVDRSTGGFVPAGDALYAQPRHVDVPALSGEGLTLCIVLDAASVEVFVGDGQAVITEQCFGHQALLARPMALSGSEARLDWSSRLSVRRVAGAAPLHR